MPWKVIGGRPTRQVCANRIALSDVSYATSVEANVNNTITNSMLIDDVVCDDASSELELELAERLFRALCELDRMTQEMSAVRFAQDHDA